MSKNDPGFFPRLPAILLTSLLLSLLVLQGFQASAQSPAGKKERRYMVQSLIKIADPVLGALSQNKLKKEMPVEETGHGRAEFTHLEAFGRLLAGMAPWLELGPDDTREGRLRAKYIRLARLCLHNATDPTGPDFMNFDRGRQPVVDAAFLTQALLRAPKQLWDPLDTATKANIIAALKSTRVITPYQSNWLLFSAMIEAGLLRFTGSCEMAPVTKAIEAHLKWYKGDGVYGDGPHFHWDYYNSYVIQPMFLEVLSTLIQAHKGDTAYYQKTYALVLKRAQRYAYILESLISPEGTYPPLGRSLAYRFGAFQLLSQIALMQQLPSRLTPGQVRAALYAVISRQLKAKGTFDAHGWLQIGMVGHQPAIAESYISTGSLYLCSEAFLVLGLPSTNAFWTVPDEDWTAKQVWEGKNISIEHAID
jgi:hypothetical protein